RAWRQPSSSASRCAARRTANAWPAWWPASRRASPDSGPDAQAGSGEVLGGEHHEAFGVVRAHVDDPSGGLEEAERQLTAVVTLVVDELAEEPGAGGDRSDGLVPAEAAALPVDPESFLF